MIDWMDRHPVVIALGTFLGLALLNGWAGVLIWCLVYPTGVLVGYIVTRRG